MKNSMKIALRHRGKHSKDHPLARLSRDRAQVIDEVVRRSLVSAKTAEYEKFVTDSLFWERKRLESKADPIRDALDQAFWKDVASQLRDTKETPEDTYRFLLKQIGQYHTEEIAGNFDPKVYSLATAVVPRGIGWLLQALSWKSFKSLFFENIDLKRKVHIHGQTDLLRKLSQKGTIIFTPTHFSNLDSMLIGWALYEMGLPPFAYGAGLNLFSNPIFGYFMNNLGAYKVDRRKRHAFYKQLLKNYSTVILERGVHSLFFPGGGRSRSGALENKVKLGLLGTGVDAYINNLLSGNANPNVYVVPCVISYHFVLEAATLIGDFLEETGKHRFIIEDDESSHPQEVAQFLIKFFKASSTIHLNIGNPLDPFGNLVDENGNSIGQSGQALDLPSFVRSNGVICHNSQRDQEYTAILGERLTSRFKIENMALTSHFVAYAYFEFLRTRFGHNDLFRLLRLSEEETTVSYKDFAEYASHILRKLHQLYDDGKLLLEPALRSTEMRNILDSAQRNMGVYHTRRPLKVITENGEDFLRTEDLKLLFYYHNRMEGYGLASTGR